MRVSKHRQVKLFDPDFSTVKDRHMRLSLELQREFGLKLCASIKIIPSLADHGNELCIHHSWNRKHGGKKIPIYTLAQRNLIRKAKAFVGEGKSLLPAHKSYDEQVSLYRKVVAGLGYKDLCLVNRDNYVLKRCKELTELIIITVLNTREREYYLGYDAVRVALSEVSHTPQGRLYPEYLQFKTSWNAVDKTQIERREKLLALWAVLHKSPRTIGDYCNMNEKNNFGLITPDFSKVEDLHTKILLELQQEFGISPFESCYIIPSLTDNGAQLLLKDSWTQNKVARSISIITKKQCEVLNRARDIAGEGKSLLLAHRSYEEQCSLFSKVMGGMNYEYLSCLLRYGYMQKRYDELTKEDDASTKALSAVNDAAIKTIRAELGPFMMGGKPVSLDNLQNRGMNYIDQNHPFTLIASETLREFEDKR
ncbi:MAG: hypothetical protein COB50_04565 [Thiotrichales bacterium]|nr:MAG: hypothetical protein COB50_04565 [Thiotrichales bacterium]